MILSPSGVQHKSLTTTNDQPFLPLDLLMGPRRHLEENHRAKPCPLISCLAGLTALLTTSSATLLIYFLLSHITHEISASKTCHRPPPRSSAFLIPLTQGSYPYLTSTLLLEPCLSAWNWPVLSLSGYPTPLFSTGDSTDHIAVRLVVARYLGEPKTGVLKHFSGIPALCPLCLHLYCGRWPAGVSG